MKYIISKELLSEVLRCEVFDVTLFKNNTVIVWENTIKTRDINIYELAHKCKEWAYGKKYFIQSDLQEVNVYPIEYDGCKMRLLVCFDIVGVDCESYTEEEIDRFPHNEPDAVFKACVFILEEINKEIKEEIEKYR